MRPILSAIATACVFLLLSRPSRAQKFYPDDPLRAEPAPVPTAGVQTRALSEILELVSNTLGKTGERHPTNGVIPADGVNTLGEVLDGPWYVNRHGVRQMTEEELVRGPGNDNPPSRESRWDVLTVKPGGVRPGILIADATKDLYLLRFDPLGSLEMSTGAEMVASRFFYALGYHVPENYIVYFERDQLVASQYGEGISSAGKLRPLVEEDIDNFLHRVARDPGKGFRAVATRVPRRWRGLLGPFQVYGTRSDDPNDIVPHEHRRDLRGLFVFCAWLNHSNMRALNTLDVLLEEDQIPQIRHYLVDFFSSLGSGSDGPKSARDGREPLYDGGLALKHLAGFGVYAPGWMRASYPGRPSVGHLDYETFDPESWVTNEELAPFANRLPDDTFWAAKKVMEFTDADVRILVGTGQYGDPQARDWIAQCLLERRNRIGQTYLRKVLPLDNLRVEKGEIAFDDLAVNYGFIPARSYSARWLSLDNELGRLTRLESNASLSLPAAMRQAAEGSWFAARIAAQDPKLEVTAYLRKKGDEFEVVGVERDWPGKAVASRKRDSDTGVTRYAELKPEQKKLFEPYAREHQEKTGRSSTPQQYYDSLPISERTSYEAVTHALLSTKLTDRDGAGLGTAFELVERLERIAGQYYGKSGDQQFRLFVHLRPAAVETLEKSREFRRDRENTVYHEGYPASFRQVGKEPTLQFSVTEDRARADIDVDYRSSKSPQALFNGHLTSANSDVRAGDNLERHNVRWGGLIGWWRQFFGNLPGGQQGPHDLLSSEKPETPTVLPPDRPRKAHIEEIQDAVQEFLTDWLVRRKYDEAIDFLSPQAYACLNLNDDRDEVVDAGTARKALQDIMSYATREMGDRKSLTAAVDAVRPWDPKRQVLAHPYDGDFTLLRMSAQEAAQYLCGRTGRSEGPSDAAYYGVLIRIKKEGAAILGLLWTREDEEWRLVSYRVFEQ